MGDAHLSRGWRKSSYSMTNGHCLEAAGLQGGHSGIHVGVRDSTDATGPVLRFEPLAWATFVTRLRKSVN